MMMTTKQGLSIIAAGIACAALLLATRSGAQTHDAFTRWEYGELLVQGDKAIFATQDRLHELEPPTKLLDGTKSMKTTWGKATDVTSVRLLHLNRLGQERWELVTSTALTDGVAYLVRRTQ